MTGIKGLLVGALAATGLAGPAAAQGSAEGAAAGAVVVSCFRGPLKQTIWDHPNPEFVDSLLGVGYDYANAEAIAQRVCQDPALVGDTAALTAEMERILARSPSLPRS